MCAIIAFNPIWITLGPVVVINAVLFVSYMSYQLWMRKIKKREFAGVKSGGSHFLSSNTREWWFWTTDPIVKIFVKLKMGPNALTAAGFFFVVISAILFALGWFGYAGWVMIFGASFDMFDGRVARITGKSSRSGAFFDAVMDRFGEGACLLGLAVYFRASFMLPIVIIALISSLLVSYTKARAEGIGVECNVGTMQRPERIVYLGVASIFDPIMSSVLSNWWAAPPPILVMMALIFIALMTTGTAVYRLIYVMNSLDTIDKRDKETIPQIIAKLSTPAGREELWDRARYGYDRTKASLSHVVLFLMGGANHSLMIELMKRGDLPNLSTHIFERGGMSQAVSVFPSTIGPTSAPFVTGAFPGTCDIPGVRWFDRKIPTNRVLTMNRFRDYLGWGAYAMDHDLSKSVRTIFEYSRQAVNIFGMLNRGCGFVRDPAFFRMHSQFYKAQTEADVESAEEAAFHWFSSAIRRETDFVLYSFPSLESGGDLDRDFEFAAHAYRRIDDYIGRAAEFLKLQGMYEKTALMFSGLYGKGEASASLDLKKIFGKRHKVCTLAKGLKDWQDSNLIALPSGTSMAHVYARNEGDWSNRSFFEDVERLGIVGSLLEQDGIDVIAGRSVDGGIVVQTNRGRAHILEDADGRVTYMIKGSDPFGYVQMPQVLDVASILESSWNTNYPDGILQILQIFRSKRSGDLVISSKNNAVLSTGNEKNSSNATHGSLLSEHMMVPFASSVLPNKDKLRTSDVFALTLDLLGIEPAHTMDGSLPTKEFILHYTDGTGSLAETRKMSKKSGGVAKATLTDFL